MSPDQSRYFEVLNGHVVVSVVGNEVRIKNTDLTDQVFDEVTEQIKNALDSKFITWRLTAHHSNDNSFDLSYHSPSEHDFPIITDTVMETMEDIEQDPQSLHRRTVAFANQRASSETRAIIRALGSGGIDSLMEVAKEGDKQGFIGMLEYQMRRAIMEARIDPNPQQRFFEM